MLPILAAVLAFITIGGLGWAFVGGGDSSDAALKRAQSFSGPRQNSAASKKAAAAATPELRRKQIMQQLQEVEKAERKARVSLGAKLKQAGLSTTVRTFWIISAVMGVFAFLLPLLFGLNILICAGAAVVFGLGLPLPQALDKMYERMPTPELKFFAIVIAIQQKTGGNLAEALSNLTTVLRARKMMGEKIKALSSEATASAGIIGSLPPAVMILVSITTPAYMAKLFTDPRGQFMLLVAVCMMGFGVFVMKKMISFKF
jgi:Flp pilus assembly protein TadB